MQRPTPEQRLIELESQHCHLEKLIEQLDEVIVAQQAQIDLLRRDVARLLAQLQASSSSSSAPAASLEEAGD